MKKIGLVVFLCAIFFVNRAEGQTEKIIALTFDDGPGIFTPQILDILKENSIHATFFIVGTNAKRFPEYVKRAYKEGHLIGNHSYAHPYMAKISETRQRREIISAEKAIQEAVCKNELCDFRPAYFRPPYGSRNKSLSHLLLALGYREIMWTTVSNDCFLIKAGAGYQAIVNQTLSNLRRDKEIVLFHDGGKNRSSVVKAMPLIIKGAKELGYSSFRRVDGL